MFKYKKFLENKDVYRWNKTFWKKSISDFLTRNLEKKIIFENYSYPEDNDIVIIENFISDKFTNGKLFYDGNPIISGKISKINKGFRIIQENPNEFEIFYKSFENESIFEINELVIVLTLTNENHNKALYELEQWFKDIKTTNK